MIAVLTVSPAPIPRLSAIVLAAVIAGIAGAVLRAGARALWRATTLPEGALIVGSGGLARATRRKIHLFPDMHVSIVGAVRRSRCERSATLRIVCSLRGIRRPAGRARDPRLRDDRRAPHSRARRPLSSATPQAKRRPPG